ncbi:hypothetical protein Nepgr_019244 [Nepenthes gracilis]|uniref:Uncharacterized protein n=1 Tax=Nepenthes gracilis TaxID=150966 RepID=A0AAD3ST11_NEPGR|nr:hypothetical protein Nepgr_019244 [Nepenthes gracilis]
MVRDHVDEAEKEDEFAWPARGHAKTNPMHSKDMSTGIANEVASSINISTAASYSASSNALVLLDPPAPTKTTKVQEMINLLSIVLSITSILPAAPQTPTLSSPPSQTPVSLGKQGDYAHQSYFLNHAQVHFNSYVVPKAQSPPQHQFPSQPQPQQLQPQPGHPQYSSKYPPLPWADATGYGNNQNSRFTDQYAYTTPQPIMNRPTMQGAQSWQQHTSSF